MRRVEAVSGTKGAREPHRCPCLALKGEKRHQIKIREFLSFFSFLLLLPENFGDRHTGINQLLASFVTNGGHE